MLGKLKENLIIDMSKKIKNKCAVITGSEGSIGQAISMKLINHGYSVIGLDIKDKHSESHTEKFIKVDLSKFANSPTVSKNLIEEIKDLLDGNDLNLLINNAAVQITEKTEEISIESWNSTLSANLSAPFFLIQKLLPFFSPTNGSVINISSIHARLTKPRFVSYATSKAAISGMTKAMAVDLGSKLRINAIEPAAIETSMLKESVSSENVNDFISSLASFHPQNRIGSPNEIANLVHSLTNGDLRFVHGACISIDGGISNRLHDPV